MLHPLDGSFLKINRAKQHIDFANDLMKGFQDRKPYRIVDTIERNGQTRERVLRFEQTEDIPDDISLIIGDVCNNLRSALDYLLWQLWLLKDPSFDGNVYFPICDDENGFKTYRTRNYIKGLSDSQRTTIKGLQPYETRNPALWHLRDVNNSDKHRLIQIIFLVGNVDRVRITADDSNALLSVPMPNNIPIRLTKNVKVENGTTFARIPLNSFSRGTKVRVQSHAFVRYAFEGSKSAHGQFVDDVINAMVSEVRRAVTLFEPDFVKFGVSKFK